jgi:hypothetical protein
LKLICHSFHLVPLSPSHITPTLISLNKWHQPPSNANTKLFCLPFWFFVDTSENLIMTIIIVMPLNHQIAPLKGEFFFKHRLM